MYVYICMYASLLKRFVYILTDMKTVVIYILFVFVCCYDYKVKRLGHRS